MKSTLKAVMAAALVLFVFTACNRVRNEKESASATEKKETEEVNISRSTPPPASRPINVSGASDAKAEEGGQNLVGSEATPQAKSTPRAVSSSAAVESLKDSTHLFIRTADIKCKVQNVANATYQVEDIVRQLGGYVSYTNLTSTVENTSAVQVCPDSSLRITDYSVQNAMIIRVPNTNLDSTLKAITPLVAYLDFRTIRANNTALEMLSNRLKQIRLAQHEQRLKNAVDLHAKKLTETTEAEDAILDKQEAADNAKISNLELADRVSYSTINLSLYQPQVIEKTLVYNEKSVKPYEPGLLVQLVASAQFGWDLLMGLLLVFVKLWPLIIGAAIAIIGYRKWKIKVASV